MALVKKEQLDNPCTVRTFFGNAVRDRMLALDTLEELLNTHNISYSKENGIIYISSSDFSLSANLYHRIPGIGQVSKLIH